MKCTQLVSWVVVCGLAVGCGGGGGGGDSTAPSISAVTIGPDLLLYEGAIEASADVQDPSGISSVKVIASGPSNLDALLAGDGLGHYAGSLALPRNDGGLEEEYQVRIEAIDRAGNRGLSAPVSVVVDSPPLPPGG